MGRTVDVFKTVYDPNTHLYKWMHCKPSNNLNGTRNGELLAVFMQYEGMRDDFVEGMLMQKPLPILFLKSQAVIDINLVRGVPLFIKNGSKKTGDVVSTDWSDTDYKCRLCLMFGIKGPSTMMKYWNAVARYKVDEQMRKEFQALDLDPGALAASR